MPERDRILPQPHMKLGRYRHYKGGEYEVLMLACDEATHDWLVIYKALYDTGDMPRVWARRYDMFHETVVTDMSTVPRFTKIADS